MSPQKLICGQPSNSLAGVAIPPRAPAGQAFWVMRDGTWRAQCGQSCLWAAVVLKCSGGLPPALLPGKPDVLG